MYVSKPTSEQALFERAQQIAGITLKQLAGKLDCAIPVSTTHAKGWVGNLLEQALGADAASAPQPDFVELGIELKSIPINGSGKPKESTYLCVVQLNPEALKSWERSLVKHKLNKVLWIPVEGSAAIPFPMRRIGSPVLWQANPAQAQQLREDWQEFADLLVMGEIEKINASMGVYLQIRPKAANAKALTLDNNQAHGQKNTLPRGFYLRTQFTQQIIAS